jgi:hypothetical protein
MSQYIFNPFVENLDRVSGLITGIQFVGVIRNANLNPGFPTPTPLPNQAWLVADNDGTVGGEPVVIGDIVLYTVNGWEIIPNGTVTIPLATEIIYGSIRVATIAETEQGSVDDAAVTPLKLFNFLQSTDFGDTLVPQLFNRLLSDGSITITDNTTSLTFSLPVIGTATTVGDVDQTLTITTDDRGRVTNVTSQPIQISASQVGDLVSYITNNFPTIITSSTLDVTGGTIDLPTLTTAGTYGNSSNFPIITIDQYGRVTSITTTSITGNPNFIEDVQDIIGTSLNSTTLNISYDDPSGLTTIEIPNTPVTSGTYGSQSTIPTFTVNSQGRLTAASNVNINIVTSQIADFVTGVRNVLSTSVGNTSNIALTWNPVTNQILADLTNVGTLGTYGDGSTIPVITTDVKGRVVNVGLVNINWAAATINASQVTNFTEAAQDAVGNALIDSSEIDFRYNDTLNQIDAVLQPTGVTAGTYTKVSVDSKGRIVTGTFLSSSDIPVHNHDGSHITTGIINVARLGVNPQPNTFLRGDGQFAVVTPTFGNQTPNTVFAGPISPPSNQPLFRALVNNDLPISTVTPGTYGSSTLIPVITINDRGIVTGVTTTTLTAPNAVWGQINGNIINQLDLINLLSNYQLTSQKGQPNGYASLDSSGRLPNSQLTIHTHGISDIVGLQLALNNKADINHTHVSNDITDFEEAVQDVVGASLTAGTGISVTYNDISGEILIENTQIPVDAEFIQDIVEQLFAAGSHSGVIVSYDDINNSMSINTTVDLNQVILQNGNSFGTNVVIGSNDSQSVIIKTNNIPRFTVGSGGNVNVGNLSGVGNRVVVANDSGDLSATINVLDIDNVIDNAIIQNGNSFGTTIIIGSNDNSDLQFKTNTVPRLTIDSNGDVNITNLAGIGDRLVVVDDSGNLSATIDVSNITNMTNAIMQDGNSFGAPVIIGSNDTQPLIIETGSTPRVTVDSNGDVNIANLSGTGDRIVVADDNGNLSATIDVTNINNAIVQNGNAFGTAITIGSNDNHPFFIKTYNIPRFLINENGYVSINDLSGIGSRIVVADDNGELSATIDVNNITSLPTIDPSTLLGRGSTSGAGQPEEITLGSGLVMTGTQLSVDTSGNPNSLQRLSEMFQDFGNFITQPYPTGTTNATNGFVDVSESPYYGVRELRTAGGHIGGSVIFTGPHNLTNQDLYVKLRTRVRYINNGFKKTSILGFTTTGVGYSSVSVLPANAAGFWIVMDAPNPPVVEIMNANSGIRTRQVINCDPYQWNEYEIRVSDGAIDYYLNNILVGTLTTNIPTANLQFSHFGHQENPANGTPILRMDYYYIAPNN